MQHAVDHRGSTLLPVGVCCLAILLASGLLIAIGANLISGAGSGAGVPSRWDEVATLFR